MTDTIVIGEGGFGCAHDPALICKGQTTSKPGHISKILYTDDATKELAEYAAISRIDPDGDFYLGQPEICLYDKTIKSNRRAVNKCRIRDSVNNNPHRYSLLIMKHGGINLVDFANEVNHMHQAIRHQKYMETFWLDAHRLLIGVKRFVDNGAVHHDIKSQNIVYNRKERRLNFIDFGITTRISTVMESSRNSTNRKARFHWSFPFESGYLNRSAYNAIAKKSEAERAKYIEALLTQLPLNIDPDFKLAAAVKIAYSMVVSCEKSRYIPNCMKPFDEFISDFTHTVLDQIRPDDETYSEFLRKSVHTFDSYGLGLAYMEVLRHGAHLIDPKFAQDLNEIFYYMYHPSLAMRNTIDETIAKYEACLDTHGILDKYDKHIVNGEIFDGPAIPAKIERLIKRIDVDSIKLSPMELHRHAGPLVMDCPEGKEYKESTHRCVKKCRPGFKRNAQYRCVKANATRRHISERSSSIESNQTRSDRSDRSDRQPDTDRWTFI